MFKRVSRPLALLAVAALAACNGGGGSSTPSAVPPQSGSAILNTIVGVGDSLTAGEQSGGLLGVPTTSPFTVVPGNLVPPTQTNGWWALFYAQAKGIALDPASYNVATAIGNPSTSPLPLIKAPGIGAILVIGNASSPTPGAPTATHSPCDSFNQAAYSASTALSVVRVNPAGTVYDVAIPGQTAHEALYQIAPLTGPPTGPGCTFPSSPTDATAGALQTLVNDESVPFYPIIAPFAAHLTTPSQVDAAVSLHPTLATVWLGANDLLKFTFSGGNMVASNTPQQMQADITTTIQRLQNAGSRVVVANLPDILHTAQFFQGGVPAGLPAVCQVNNYFFCAVANALSQNPATAPVANTVAANATATIGAAPYNVGAGAYLTETGFFNALQQIIAGVQGGNLNPSITLNPGDFLPAAFATQVQGLNDSYNASIAAAATATGAGLVDINGIFKQIYAGTFPGQFISTKCCSLVFGGGLLSWDGLHPSDTGYAFLANAFIGEADAKYGLSIPPLSPTTVLTINAYDTYHF